MQEIQKQLRKDKLQFLKTGIKSDLIKRIEVYNAMC